MLGNIHICRANHTKIKPKKNRISMRLLPNVLGRLVSPWVGFTSIGCEEW
jgi:hypothetical protein